MARYYPDEYEPLISDLKAGLEAALYEVGEEVSGPDMTPSGEIKRNSVSTKNFVGVNEDLVWIDKLAVAAIREIDDFTSLPGPSDELPIMYSWYRYGRATPIGRIRPDNLNPGRLDRCIDGSPYESSYRRDFPTAEEFCMFFEEQINKMDAFGPDLYGFLEDDYQNGPGAWQKVYLSNLKIQKELFDIYQMAPGTILDEETITKLIDACHGPISDLELSARRVEGINEDATRNMSQYLNTFRDLLIGMRTYDDIVRYSQSQLFEEIVKTYHGCVWTWVSSIASTQTVDEDKERADSLKEDNAQFVQENKSYWTGRVEDLQGSLEDTGLKPSNSDYQNELDPKTKQLMEPIESTFLS